MISDADFGTSRFFQQAIVISFASAYSVAFPVECDCRNDNQFDFVNFAKDNGIPARWYYINQSQKLLVQQIRALIIRETLGVEEFYKYYNKTDNTVNAALKALNEGKGRFPITVEIQGNHHYHN